MRVLISECEQSLLALWMGDPINKHFMLCFLIPIRSSPILFFSSSSNPRVDISIFLWSLSRRCRHSHHYCVLMMMKLSCGKILGTVRSCRRLKIFLIFMIAPQILSTQCKKKLQAIGRNTHVSYMHIISLWCRKKADCQESQARKKEKNDHRKSSQGLNNALCWSIFSSRGKIPMQ